MESLGLQMAMGMGNSRLTLELLSTLRARVWKW
jgi:hypothetical protein